MSKSSFPGLPQLYRSLLAVNVSKAAPIFVVPPLAVLALGCGIFWAFSGFGRRDAQDDA